MIHGNKSISPASYFCLWLSHLKRASPSTISKPEMKRAPGNKYSNRSGSIAQTAVPTIKMQMSETKGRSRPSANRLSKISRKSRPRFVISSPLRFLLCYAKAWNVCGYKGRGNDEPTLCGGSWAGLRAHNVAGSHQRLGRFLGNFIITGKRVFSYGKSKGAKPTPVARS